MLEVGVLKTWDSVNYKAGVQLAGSLTTYFDNLNVARNIASGDMTIGRRVIVAIPEATNVVRGFSLVQTNPKDAVVIAVFTV